MTLTSRREPSARREDFAFLHPLRVRWSEVDPQSIVFNPNYMVYADIAMGEYLRTLGHTFASEAVTVFAVHAEVDFFGSARYDDELEIGARTAYMGRSSFRMLYGIFRGAQLLSEVRMAYVHAGLIDRKTHPLPADLVASIVAFERVPPERK